jgi:two-component system, cell cycle response regulator
MRAEEFLKLAMLDHMTELHNRRFAQERLAAEMIRSERHGYPLTVLLLDLDAFKQLNDKYGQKIGVPLVS